MFAQRRLVIATKHCKEQVIAPVLEKELGVHCFVAPDLDTDLLGTFTGEIERLDDPLTTARKKCFKAMELSGCDMAVASEGSFGPHPSVFFASADDEILMFIDVRNQLEIVVRELSTDTNFNGSEIKNHEELLLFAQRCRFPSHGLIVRKTKEDTSEIIKGITHHTTLLQAFDRLWASSDSVYVETDMRALYNPTRMKVIEKAAHKLAAKINARCPECQTPGFGVTDAKPGLPCSLCRRPTRSTLSYLYTCAHCHFVHEEKFPHHKYTEDPMYCDICNP